MICKNILLVIFLNKPKLILFAHSKMVSSIIMYH